VEIEKPTTISEQIKDDVQRMSKKFDIPKTSRKEKVDLDEPTRPPLSMSTPRKIKKAEKQRRLEEVFLP
jgi:hypothetical protein